MTTTLKSCSNDELQTMLYEATRRREEHRELAHTGQNPEFWKYEIERQAILSEMDRRKIQRKVDEDSEYLR